MSQLTAPAGAVPLATPRLGFLGVGWIGRNRLEAVAASGAGRVVGIADPHRDRVAAAAEAAPGAGTASSLDELLEMGVDGIVIATPSALHAEQCIRALEAGAAVFCQKPLARTAAEVRGVVDAARGADRLLGIDLSYRQTAAMVALRELVRSGMLGNVHAVDLVFHNAYGPDGGWARDAALSGGGCVIDLGIHLVDLALWCLDFPAASQVQGHCFAGGRPLPAGAAECEDFAVATFRLATGTVVRMACSWESSTGRDAVIEAVFHGAEGGAAMRNLNGSFYDFAAEHFRGTSARTLASPPDHWGGRAILEWTRRLAAGGRYDPEVEQAIPVAEILDGVLGR
jgi:predicted dehydrogenase